MPPSIQLTLQSIATPFVRASWRGDIETSIDIDWKLAIEFTALRDQAFKDGTRMKTFSAKPHEVKREWLLVDATDKVLGRLAAEIARRLRGKHKPEFTPHVDTGDFVIVTNVEKLRVTGNKAEDKIYYRHTGFPGGIYETSFKKMQQRFPARILEKAVKGMLPKGPLGYAMLKKLKCYAGGAHPHAAQQPKVLEL
jgi:large subunit ribosomal protein L13